MGYAKWVAVREDRIRELGKGRLLQLYETMYRIRRFEEEIADLYRRGLVPSSAHVYIGQEAVAAGVCANLERGDYVLTTHRGHAHNVAMGVPLNRLAAEILGKVDGVCRGRGGSMRVCSPEHGLLYACPIVGANIPIAVGVGLSLKRLRPGRVVACFFGDGASNIGDFHEGLNLAAVWKVPVIFICENNQYALSTSMERSTSVKNIADRACAYGIPSYIVDGNDVVAVYEAARTAVERARQAGTPTLIECKTYRWLGHHVGDPGTAYRTAEEVEEWKKKCPIERLKRQLLTLGIAGVDEINEIEAKVNAEVKDAVDFAVGSPYPPEDELMEFVY